MHNSEQSTKQILLIGGILALLVCLCVGLSVAAGGGLFQFFQNDAPAIEPYDETSARTANLTVAVSPGMAPTLDALVEQFNALGLLTPDGLPMRVETVAVVPEDMVDQSLARPPFQAIAPDSSLWLNQLDLRWEEVMDLEGAEGEEVIPIGNRRFSDPVRYATSPVVIAAWESVARELGWPDESVGWQEIQTKATGDPDFKWNHPSTGHASGLLATLAEFYAGAGVTRGLTPEAATAQSTLDYVQQVESTVRFYGEGEDVIVQRLAEDGKDFLDAFVTQEQVVVAWNQAGPTERLIALYPAEGTLWADHPLALLELGGVEGESSVTDGQRYTYQAFTDYLTSEEAQQQLLNAGYRPADLAIPLDQAGSPFSGTDAVDWREPQTTLQIPSQEVVSVVQNVWWYTKRPTNVCLVVDVSGSMEERGKLSATKRALEVFVDQIRGNRDQICLITFESQVYVLRSLDPMDESGRSQLQNAIRGLQAAGQTALIDGIWEAYTELLSRGDPEMINAIVVMTDGIENNSFHTLTELRNRLENTEGPPVVIFTIAFGDDADVKLLRNVAEMGHGQFRHANETDIEDLYKVISTYF